MRSAWRRVEHLFSRTANKQRTNMPVLGFGGLQEHAHDDAPSRRVPRRQSALDRLMAKLCPVGPKSALFWAAREGNIETIKELLAAKKAKVNWNHPVSRAAV